MGKRSRRRRPGRGGGGVVSSTTTTTAPSSMTLTTLEQQQQQQHRALVAERHLRNRERGDPRAQANRLMREFLSHHCSPNHQDPWNTERFNIFYSYIQVVESTSTMKVLDYDSQREHLRFLKNIRRNRAEPTFYRALAYGATGLFYLFSVGASSFDIHGVVMKYIEKSFSLLDSADDSEKQKIVILDGEAVCIHALFQSQRDLFTHYITEYPSGFHGKYSMSAWNPYNGTAIRYSIIAGFMCDYVNCEKCADELEDGKCMSCCGRCKMTYYCSEECQHKAWKEEGHKFVCRKRGDFRVGDIALVTKSAGAIESEQIVKLIAKIANSDGNGESPSGDWVVQKRHGSESGTVSVDSLRRVRSSVWYPFTRKDLDKIAKTLVESGERTSFATNDDEENEEVPRLLSHSFEGEFDANSDDEN